MRSIYYIFPVCCILFLNISCTHTRQLGQNEYLLYKERVKGNKDISTENLTILYKQETNRKFFWMTPYVGIYNIGKFFFDSSAVVRDIQQTTIKYDNRLAENSGNLRQQEKLQRKKERKIRKLQRKLKEGNWVMRAPGEPPAIFDSSLMSATAKQMEYYLFSKGYFNGKVSPQVDTSGKTVRVTYHIYEGAPRRIKKISYNIEDRNIRSMIMKHLSESKIKGGEIYNEEKISGERERLHGIMKNSGYYDFTRQFIFFEVDTTIGKNQLAIEVIIRNPPDQAHKRYTISDVYFNTDVTPRKDEQRDTVYYNGVNFIYYDPGFSKKLLNNKLRLHPGDVYSQQMIQKSQRHLAGLDMYKFININFDKNRADSTGTSLIANIHTSPMRRFQITQEYGLNVGQGYIPGPFGNITFKERNIFKGFEVFEASLRYSIDGQASVTNPDDVFRTQEYGLNLSLTFPQLFFPTHLRYRFDEYNPKTRLLTGYNFIDRPEYKRQSVRAGLNYTWMKNIHKQFNFSPVDINIVNSHVDAAFGEYLDFLATLGNRLNVSFRNAIVTSMNAFFVFNNNELGKIKPSRYFRPYVELGGIAPNLFSRMKGEADNQLFGLQYFEFYKASSDLRYYFPVRRKNIFAMRFNLGFARPYGSSAAGDLFVLPYEKYFFTGGSSSIRAWRPMRLGPGAYKEAGGRYRFEQPGEILFETSYEYRFNIFSFFDGAVFIDAGNVWTLRDHTREGSQFRVNSFYEQIGIGAGYGVRLDFSFLILRFDLGTKIYDPGEPAGERLLLKHLAKKPPFGRRDQSLINIGIGYPF